jgi:hypothetical protein
MVRLPIQLYVIYKFIYDYHYIYYLTIIRSMSFVCSVKERISSAEKCDLLRQLKNVFWEIKDIGFKRVLAARNKHIR